MEFNYYYGKQADQFSFIRIPRALLVDPLFDSLTLQAKFLYGVLLDRMGLSMKYGWFDEKNRVYIIYKIDDIMKNLGISKKKAIDYLAELESFGLVEKKRRGRGQSNLIYVKSFIVETEETRSTKTGTSMQPQQKLRSTEIDTSCSEHQVLSGSQIDTSRGSEIAPLEVPESTLLEVPESTPLNSNNNINNTYKSNIKSNHILSFDGGEVLDGYDGDKMRSARTYAQIISENIEFEVLKQNRKYDVELLDGIYELILETLVCNTSTIVIASNEYPIDLVRNKFLKLTTKHVEYVLDCINRNSTKVRNIKKYLLAALFNAPSTIGGYYRAEVNHDMPFLIHYSG